VVTFSEVAVCLISCHLTLLTLPANDVGWLARKSDSQQSASAKKKIV